MAGNRVQDHYAGDDTGSDMASRILAAVHAVHGREAAITPETLAPLDHLSLSRFAAGSHVGAVRGAPGAPPASAAARPCPSQGEALSPPHRPQPPKKVGVRDRVWALGCARHHAGCVFPLAANHLIEINSDAITQ
jgi:hypothetical protein